MKNWLDSLSVYQQAQPVCHVASPLDDLIRPKVSGAQFSSLFEPHSTSHRWHLEKYHVFDCELKVATSMICIRLLPTLCCKKLLSNALNLVHVILHQV